VAQLNSLELDFEIVESCRKQQLFVTLLTIPMGVGYAVKASTGFPVGELTLLVLHK
jgi:hypothetical protein